MSLPNVLVNTFNNMKKNIEKPDLVSIDPVSKCFIVAEALFGFNRLNLVVKSRTLYILSVIYTVTIIIFTSFNSIFFQIGSPNFSVTVTVCLSQYIIYSLWCLLFGKDNMQQFYAELNEFDKEVGCKPSVTRQAILNVLRLFCLLLIIFVVYILPYELGMSNIFYLYFIPYRCIYVIETGYCGHLISLLNARLQLIYYYLESLQLVLMHRPIPELSNKYVVINITVVNKQREVENIMNNYIKIVKIYRHLKDGIKYQLLGFLIFTFVTMVTLSYRVMLEILENGGTLVGDTVAKITKVFTMMLPILLPCIFGDDIYSNVIKLKELLANMLFEDKLEKPDRDNARALLTLTETQDMSFRLFRVLDLNISLPFKFIGLVITYLILMLQFHKVINP